MSTKQKTASAKAKWQAVRERYTWHLRPPFKEQFDRSHWWLKPADSEVEPVAALYELARRHPRIGELRNKLRHASWHGQELRIPLVGTAKKGMMSQAFDDLGKEPKAIHCLCLIGLKSWSTLGGRDKDYWMLSMEKMKGMDCRTDLEVCNSITLSALTDVLIRRANALKGNAKSMTREEFNWLVVKDWLSNPASNKEIESAIVQEAVAAHRQGNLLIAVAPDLAATEAESLLATIYRRHRVLKPPQQRASWWKEWLPLISEFENEAMNRPINEKLNPQIFAHYRRALDGIRFETAKLGGHPVCCQHILAAREFFLHECLNSLAGLEKQKRKMLTTRPN